MQGLLILYMASRVYKLTFECVWVCMDSEFLADQQLSLISSDSLRGHIHYTSLSSTSDAK